MKENKKRKIDERCIASTHMTHIMDDQPQIQEVIFQLNFCQISDMYYYITHKTPQALSLSSLLEITMCSQETNKNYDMQKTKIRRIFK